jgi:hypothetical protein
MVPGAVLGLFRTPSVRKSSTEFSRPRTRTTVAPANAPSMSNMTPYPWLESERERDLEALLTYEPFPIPKVGRVCSGIHLVSLDLSGYHGKGLAGCCSYGENRKKKLQRKVWSNPPKQCHLDGDLVTPCTVVVPAVSGLRLHSPRSAV